MDFTLKELGKKEILSLYRRFLTKFFNGSKKDFLISESAVRWLIARKICYCYGLYDEGGHLLCFGLFTSDLEKKVLLLDYFVVLKKYRGFNFAEIFFDILKEMLTLEAQKTEKAELFLGIFIEIAGVAKLSEEAFNQRQKELKFYREVGAYITDIIPGFANEEYNVLFLPLNARLSRSELKREFLNVCKEILPSFKDKKKYITRLTEEVDGLI